MIRRLIPSVKDEKRLCDTITNSFHVLFVQNGMDFGGGEDKVVENYEKWYTYGVHRRISIKFPNIIHANKFCTFARNLFFKINQYGSIDNGCKYR